MSNLIDFVAMYQAMDVDAKAEEIPADELKYHLKGERHRVRLENGVKGFDDGNESYGGFFTVAYFDADGKFIYQGVWE